jgi:hypothetical protein
VGLLLIPLAIVAVLVMLLLGAAALVIAVAREVPWLLILGGVWLLVRAQHGPAHRRAKSATRQHTNLGSTRGPLQRVEQSARPQPAATRARELPIDLQVKVEQIRRKADLLLGYADRFPPCSQDLHIVRQTAAEYLPATTAAYLALPGHDDPVIAASGKTALQELSEQLQLLDSKLDDIAQDLQRQDLDRLLANRNFLENRFRLQGHEAAVGGSLRETDAA